MKKSLVLILLVFLLLNFVSADTPEKIWTGYHSSSVTSGAFSSDGLELVTGSFDKTLKIWQVSNGNLINTINAHTGEIWSVDYSSNGMIASGSADKSVKLWTSNGSLIRTLTGHNSSVRGVAFSPDGALVASASQDGSVKIWNVNTGALVRTLTVPSGGWMLSVAFSPDGSKIAVGGGLTTTTIDGTVAVFRVSDGTLLFTGKDNSVSVGSHNDWVMDVSFSPDGSKIASASVDFTAKIWNSADGSLIRTLTGFPDAANSLSFSPNGQYLVITDWSKNIVVYNMSNYALTNAYTESTIPYFAEFHNNGISFAYGLASVNQVVYANTFSSYNKLTAPASPGSLSADATNDKVNLRWSDNANNEEKFVVERAKSGRTLVFNNIASPSADSTSYSDPSVSSGSTYYYRIKAVNSAGSSAYSSELTVKVPRKSIWSYFTGNVIKVKSWFG